MPLELKKESQTQLMGSIQQYFQLHMEEEIGDLKATLLLQFILEEVGPVIYNQAVSDCQAVMQDRTAELDSVCFEPEGEFWRKKK
ncbi:MAG: DUF2164 domain-containing protein [bacterium]|nr:DUF2164 domain-containing protein [bacterium]